MSNSARTQPHTFKSYRQRAALVALTFGYIVLWLGGVVQHFLYDGIAPEQNWIASLFLLLAGTIVWLGADVWSERLMIAGVALFGFAVEALGVHTGFPFGAYDYTDVLSPKLFQVPLVMACAWLTLIVYIKGALAKFRMALWVQSIAGALWMTAIDLIIDPVAANHLGYWRWERAGVYYGIPFTNFVGWFAASALTFYLFRSSLKPNVWAQFVGLSITLFFTLLAFAHALYVAALFGCAVCALHFFLHNLSGKRAAL
jgi:uncharacterized membrane protein